MSAIPIPLQDAQKLGQLISDLNSPIDVGYLILEAMITTGLPVHLAMWDKSLQHGHSVVVFGYDSSNKCFRLYDSNVPDKEVNISYDTLTGLGSYSEHPDVDDVFAYLTDDTLGESAQFENIISVWERGTLKDYFANLSIKDYNAIETQNLSFNSDVNIAIPSTDKVTLYGHFTSPVNNSNTTNYLFVMQNGKRLSQAVTAIPASGDFSFNIDGTNAQNTEIVLMVSGHDRDPFTGFAAFGKFIVTPRPTILPEGTIFVSPGATYGCDLANLFKVVGGTPPYTVYSSDSSAVYNAAPGDGVWTVTANGDIFIVHTGSYGTSYLTVKDSTGATGISKTFLMLTGN